jgi:type IV pilus assembly protein PilC
MAKRALDPVLSAMFWRQLATLLRGGLPLPDALLAVGRDSESGPLRDMTERLREAVEEGEALSDALNRFPREFDRSTIACIRAGERSGALVEIVAMVASFSEKTHSMRLRGRMVLTYPAILWIFSLVVCTGLFGWILPASEAMQDNLGFEAPLIVRFAISTLYAISIAWLLSLAAALAVSIAYRFPGRLPWVRRSVDRMLLRLPVWSRYYRSHILARFVRTLSTLLRAGVPLHESLVLSGEAAGNTRVAEESRKAAAAIRDGERATAALEPGDAFSSAALWSLRIAEDRGDFEETLGSLADYYDETAEIGAATVLTAAEPLAIAVVGIFAAATVLAMALPTLHFYTLVP